MTSFTVKSLIVYYDNVRFIRVCLSSLSGPRLTLFASVCFFCLFVKCHPKTFSSWFVVPRQDDESASRQTRLNRQRRIRTKRLHSHVAAIWQQTVRMKIHVGFFFLVFCRNIREWSLSAWRQQLFNTADRPTCELCVPTRIRINSTAWFTHLVTCLLARKSASLSLISCCLTEWERREVAAEVWRGGQECGRGGGAGGREVLVGEETKEVE